VTTDDTACGVVVAVGASVGTRAGPVVGSAASASGDSGVPVGSVLGDVVGDVVDDGLVDGLVDVVGDVVVDVVSVGAGDVEEVAVGVRTGVVGVAPGVVMTVVTCSTTVGVVTSATSSLAELAATVTRASTTGALCGVTTPAVVRVVDTATGTVAASAGARLLRKTWMVTALTWSGDALSAVAAVAALSASFAAEETADRTARSTAGVKVACTDSSCRRFMTADREELTALTTICRAELAWVSERPPIGTTIDGGTAGVRPLLELGVGTAGVGADERVADEDGRTEPPLGTSRRPVRVPPTVKLPPGTLGRVLRWVVGVVTGIASTVPGLRSPWVPEGRPASAEPPGMKPSTATAVRVSEETAATAAAGTPERTASDADGVRWWRAREVARPLMSSSRSGAYWTDRCHPVGRGTADWSACSSLGPLLCPAQRWCRQKSCPT
jgi:hypothetical protein